MFCNREKEQQELTAILDMEPSLVYFVHGPMNSGKTTLVKQVLDSRPENAVPFYINLRGRNIESPNDFLHALFSVDYHLSVIDMNAYVGEILGNGINGLKKRAGVPIPGDMFDMLFHKQDKGADTFTYLETFFDILVHSEGLSPIFIIDEIQMLKNVNEEDRNPLLDRLFNFFIRMTKETHLCHCLTVSNDSIFLLRIQDHAGMDGRSQSLLIDDLDKPRALAIYEEFGFTDKQRVWSYLGGKIGDMVMLQTWLARGYDQTESLDRMLRVEAGRLELIESGLLEKNQQECAVMMDFLYHVGRKGQIEFKPKPDHRKVRFWSDRHVMYLEPDMGIVKPQGQLVRRAIHAMEGL